MKYTRYNYKSVKGGKVILLLMLVILIGLIIGGSIFNLCINRDGNNNREVEGDTSVYVIQCGVFKNKENAKKFCEELKEGYTKFMADEDEMTKVLVGIYPKEKINEIRSDLSKKGVNSIINELTVDTKNSKLMIEVIDAYMVVAEKLTDKNVKSIETIGLKEWINKNIDGISLSKEEEELINIVKNLPNEYDLSKSQSDIQKIYELLKKNYN